MSLLKYVVFLLLNVNIAVAQAPSSQTMEILQAPIIDLTEESARIDRNTIIPLYVQPSLQSEIDRLSIKYSVDSSLASRIIKCESSNKPNAIGTLAVVGKDVGYWQLNTYFHEESAIKMGLDIYTPEDNLEYGFWLLSTQGSRHWNASRACWG